MNPEHKRFLDDFGRMLMNDVRDDAIEFLKRVESGRMADEHSRSQYVAYTTVSSEAAKVIDIFVTAAVDACLARFLNFFDEHELPLVHRLPDGTSADLRKISGGLAGELYTPAGWVAKYSKFPSS